MLSSEAKSQLIDALCMTAEAMGSVITPMAAAMMADDLQDYDLGLLARALKACRQEVKGRLTVADIIQRCQAEDGRPGKDEAWSIALDASDEYGTAVMTTEIQQAMASSNILLDEGDMVGARMAFISTYERLVREARQDARPVEWHVSIGIAKDRREPAIQRAVQLGRITQDQAALHCKPLALSAPSATGLAIAGLLTGKVVKPNEEHREKLNALRESFKKRSAELAAMTPEEKIEARKQELIDHRKMVKGIEGEDE